jgi:hypothetical protein
VWLRQATARSATTLSPEKLALGLPFYARHTATGEWRTYDELLRAHGEALTRRMDEVLTSRFGPTLMTGSPPDP